MEALVVRQGSVGSVGSVGNVGSVGRAEKESRRNNCRVYLDCACLDAVLTFWSNKLNNSHFESDKNARSHLYISAD